MMEPKQAEMLEAIYDAVVGSTKSVGLQEQVRSLDVRLTRVEGLATKAATTLWERGWQIIAAGAAGWFASHFPGTRP